MVSVYLLAISFTCESIVISSNVIYPIDYKRNWWKISMETMKGVAAALEPRGVREREFLASITRLRTEHAWEPTLKV